MSFKVNVELQKEVQRAIQSRKELEAMVRSSLSQSVLSEVRESVEECLPAIVEKIATDPKISNELQSAETTTKPSTARRRNALSAAIDKARQLAKETCGDEWNVALIFSMLKNWADEEFPPFLAATDQGLKYQKGNSVDYLTLDQLKYRILRLKNPKKVR